MSAPEETRNPFVMADPETCATPEQVMGTCLRLELEAAALYKQFEAEAPDGELARLWAAMAAAETHHARLVSELASRRDFVVPAVPLSMLRGVVDRVGAIRGEAETAAPLTAERMLGITAALEFSEMDDLFTAVCRAAGVSNEAGRAEHLAPLVEAVLARQSGDVVVRHLLAALIRLERRAGAAPAH